MGNNAKSVKDFSKKDKQSEFTSNNENTTDIALRDLSESDRDVNVLNGSYRYNTSKTKGSKEDVPNTLVSDMALRDPNELDREVVVKSNVYSYKKNKV